ncbi:MAG: RNA polymerase sigma-70 factor [Prolixibacteraceae bacterium]
MSQEISRVSRKADDLFYLIKQGDQQALGTFFTIYFARLNDFARKIVGVEAISQDIVQEVFLKVWEKRADIEVVNIEAFLFRLVRNRCIDYIKHTKVENNRMEKIQFKSKFEELYRIDFVGNEPYLLIEKELQLQIEKTIQSLPDRCREVFIHSRIHGLKNREVAEKLNISIKNVERHLSRALQSFRENLSEEIFIGLLFLIIRGLGLM